MGAAEQRERQAAYFTFLRAVDERDALMAYREWLLGERERLEAFAADTRERTEQVPAGLRRPVGATTKPLLEALGARRAVVLRELSRIDGWVADAEAFVAECEAQVERLRG